MAPIGACLLGHKKYDRTFVSSVKGRQPLARYGCSMNIWNDEIFCLEVQLVQTFSMKAMIFATYMHTTSRRAFGHVSWTLL